MKYRFWQESYAKNIKIQLKQYKKKENEIGIETKAKAEKENKEARDNKELQEKFLGVISSEAVRMTKLVSDLLTLSKHDDTNTKWEKTEFDLGELVKNCQEFLQIEMEKKHQKVECFVTANVPHVYADRDGIERVVLNILSNSVKYTPKRRRNKNICRICI